MADGDITKFDTILNKKIGEVLLFLSYKISKSKLEAEMNKGK